MKRFTSVLLSIFRFLLILAACIGVAFIVVWPLWKFSTANAKAYTITVLTVIAVLAVFAAVRKIISGIKAKRESK